MNPDQQARARYVLAAMLGIAIVLAALLLDAKTPEGWPL